MSENVPELRHVDRRLTPDETVEAANMIAHNASKDVPIRALAKSIALDGHHTSNAFEQIPERIAHWIVENIHYSQETPGVEILQGPYSTIPAGTRVGSFVFEGCGTGDCDDLSILFTALCRSLGIEAFAAGVKVPASASSYVHCIGYVRSTDTYYELSIGDEAYGGLPDKTIVMSGLNPGSSATIFDPTTSKFSTQRGPSAAQVKVQYDKSRVRKMKGRRMSAMAQSVAGEYANAFRMAGVGMPDLGAQFGGVQLGTEEANDYISDGINQLQNLHEIDILGLAFPQGMSTEGAVDTTINAINGLAGEKLGGGTREIISAAGSSVPLIMGGATLGPPGIIAAAVVASVNIATTVARVLREHRQAIASAKNFSADTRSKIYAMCVTAGFDPRGSEAQKRQFMWTYTRTLEVATILSDNYGFHRQGTRDNVRIGTYEAAVDLNVYTNWLGYSARDAADIRNEFNQQYGSGVFLDGVQFVKGLNWALQDKTRDGDLFQYITATKRIPEETYNAVNVIDKLCKELAKVATGSTPGTAVFTEMYRGLLLGLLCDIQSLGITTAAQYREKTIPQGDGEAIADKQLIIPIDYDVFWGFVRRPAPLIDERRYPMDLRGFALDKGILKTPGTYNVTDEYNAGTSNFKRNFGKTPPEMLLPVERAFGLSGLADGGFFSELLDPFEAGTLFPVFDEDARTDIQDIAPNDYFIPGENGRTAGQGSGGGGGGAAALAAAAGALFLFNS